MKKLFSFFKPGHEPEPQRLDITSIGLALGILGVLAISVYSLLAAYTGYGIEAEAALEGLLPGYTLTVGGAIVGAVWMFSIGYILGVVFAWIYDNLVKKN
jgi:hypothetical protein